MSLYGRKLPLIQTLLYSNNFSVSLEFELTRFDCISYGSFKWYYRICAVWVRAVFFNGASEPRQNYKQASLQHQESTTRATTARKTTIARDKFP